MGNLPGSHGQGLFGGQQTAYGGYYPPPYNPGQGPYPPQGYPPQGYPPQGYPPQGYPPQGYHPGYPTGQMYPGPGYHQQGYPGGYGRPGSPGAGLGQAASCGSLMACLTCLFCSCSPCLMGAGAGPGMRSEDEAGEDHNEEPETAYVSSPQEPD